MFYEYAQNITTKYFLKNSMIFNFGSTFCLAETVRPKAMF